MQQSEWSKPGINKENISDITTRVLKPEPELVAGAPEQAIFAGCGAHI